MQTTREKQNVRPVRGLWAQDAMGTAGLHFQGPPSEDNTHRPESYPCNPAEKNRPQQDLDLSALCVAVIEDAVDVLKKGDPRVRYSTDGEGRNAKAWMRDKMQAWREAAFWMFFEEDPDGEESFSLTWCCEVITLTSGVRFDPMAIRERAAKLGLVPPLHIMRGHYVLPKTKYEEVRGL